MIPAQPLPISMSECNAAECNSQAAVPPDTAPPVSNFSHAPNAASDSCRKRLTFNGGPGDQGYERKVKILQQCMQFKGSLFCYGKRAEVYKMVAEDLNKYHADLFGNGQLKENTVREIWNKCVKDAEAQQADKEKNHHLWYNGSILSEMTTLELLLDEIFIEGKKAAEEAEGQKAAEAAEEQDK